MSNDEELDERIARAMREIRREEPPPDRAVDAILAHVRRRPRPLRTARRSVGLASLTVLAIAAAAAIVMVVSRPRNRAVEEPRRAAAVARAADAQPVRFSLDAPGVSRVAVVGDFSNWRPVALRRVDGSAQWTITLPIAAGRYTYVFVVDGARWVADPTAPVAPDADFGTGGSVLVVERGRAGGAS